MENNSEYRDPPTSLPVERLNGAASNAYVCAKNYTYYKGPNINGYIVNVKKFQLFQKTSLILTSV